MNIINNKFVNRDVLVLASVSLLIAGVIGSALSQQNVLAQTNSTASQNQANMSNMTMGAGDNITGSIPLGSTIAKAIASQIHVSLANASVIAEKAVGANAHAASVRLGVAQGSLVYTALVVDSNNNFHSVLVDPGNGKVLAFSQIPQQHLLMNDGMGIGTMYGGGGGMGMKAHMMGIKFEWIESLIWRHEDIH